MPKNRERKPKSRRLIGIRNLKQEKCLQSGNDLPSCSSYTTSSNVLQERNQQDAIPAVNNLNSSIDSEILNDWDQYFERVVGNSEENSEINIDGRRIVNISFFMNSIAALSNHEPFNCGFSEMTVVKEKRRGLISCFQLKCKLCHLVKDLYTEDPKLDRTHDANATSVLSTISTGCGYSQLNEQLGILDIPSLSYRQYQIYHNKFSTVMYDTMLDVLRESGEEEHRLAVELGDVDQEGNGLISVIVDGAWSKRSYKVNYDALSGVACIIGARTGQILFVSTKNKFCPICSRANNANRQVEQHNCSKNWTGSSTAMEAQLILEGFRQSVTMHKLKYIQIIGDGDSSVYKKILQDKPYGLKPMVKKIECSNHLLRNYCSKLREISGKKISSRNRVVHPRLRNILKCSIIRMRNGIKSAMNVHRKSDIPMHEKTASLIADIQNCPFHVFGDHKKCSTYFCKGSKENEINYIEEMDQCGLLEDITVAGNRLIHHAASLILNMNTNLAECYNSVIAKFTGGKRINFSCRNSYSLRCQAAAIHFNKPHEYVQSIYRTTGASGIGKFTKRYLDKISKKRLLEKRLRRQQIRRRKNVMPADQDYGAMEEKPINNFEEKKEIYLNGLKKTRQQLLEIELLTRGQASNPRWLEEKQYLLTASNFGVVCKRRATTNPSKLVTRLLFPVRFFAKATEWGRDHEDIARRYFEEQTGHNVQPIGLFIYKKMPYLGASPDGKINENEIVEIKCPFSCSNLTPEEGTNQKKIKFLEEKNGRIRLKRNHNYYYQVQGQLAITGAEKCHFIVWTPLGMFVEVIFKDPQFWERAEDKLSNFYLQFMLPLLLLST